MESNVRRRGVLVELDIQRRGVRVEVQAARHAVVGALVLRDVGDVVGLEERADEQAVDADARRVPGRDARRVAVVEALVPVVGLVEPAVVAEPLGRVVVVDVAPVEAEVVHLVLDGPLGGGRLVT